MLFNMKRKGLLIALFFIFLSTSLFAQIEKILGDWYIVDEEGIKKTIINIYRTADGIYEGMIISILVGDTKGICKKCPGSDRGKPFMGLVIIRKMREENGKLVGGTILDPMQGKSYYSSISYDEKTGILKVRGSLDRWGLIGRNQRWVKVEE